MSAPSEKAVTTARAVRARRPALLPLSLLREAARLHIEEPSVPEMFRRPQVVEELTATDRSMMEFLASALITRTAADARGLAYALADLAHAWDDIVNDHADEVMALAGRLFAWSQRAKRTERIEAEVVALEAGQ